MNIQRGLTRLWIVMSALWVLTMSVLLYDQITMESTGAFILGGYDDINLINYIQTPDGKMKEIRKEDFKLDISQHFFLLLNQNPTNQVKEGIKEKFLKNCIQHQASGVWASSEAIVNAYLSNLGINNLKPCDGFYRLGMAVAYVENNHIRDKIKAISIITLPPIFCYISILAFLWIVRGFRSV
jgi:hypothetical protein